MNITQSLNFSLFSTGLISLSLCVNKSRFCISLNLNIICEIYESHHLWGCFSFYSIYRDAIYYLFNSGSVDLTCTSSFCTLSHDSVQTNLIANLIFTSVVAMERSFN